MKLLPSKRFWKRLAAALAILAAIGLLVNGVLAWRTESRLQARLAAVRAAGDPASIADLAPKPIPDVENAAAILERIRPRITQFASEHGRFFNTPLGIAYDDASKRGEPATKEQLDAIRAILAKYADVESVIAQAAKCDTYASRLDFSANHTDFIKSLVDAQSNVRSAARLVNWRIELLLADGQQEPAVERGIQTFRLARLYESEPSMVAFLVAIAIRGMAAEQMYDAMAAGPVSSELRKALDAELAQMDNPQRLVRALKTERAIGAAWNGAMLGQPNPFLAHALGWPIKSFQIGVVDYSNEYLQLAGRPWHEVRAQFGSADSTAPPTGHGILADLLAPAVRAVFQANARSLAVSRALRIHIALRQFVEKNGREANGLEELELPKDAITDPFSGEPLKLKSTEKGWVIYSVMENGVDDGGDFKKLKDFGVAPPKQRLTE